MLIIAIIIITSIAATKLSQQTTTVQTKMAVGMYEERHLQTDDGIDFIEIAKTEEMEAEEDYEFPLWAGMIICVIFAIICVVMVFYFSYKHEQRKRPEDLQKKDPRGKYYTVL